MTKNSSSFHNALTESFSFSIMSKEQARIRKIKKFSRLLHVDSADRETEHEKSAH